MHTVAITEGSIYGACMFAILSAVTVMAGTRWGSLLLNRGLFSCLDAVYAASTEHAKHTAYDAPCRDK